MSEIKDRGCHEYNALSRRRFLTGTAQVTLLTATLPAWLPRVVLAQGGGSSRDILVSIYLRGGADGLSLCVPHGADEYYAARPTIAIPRPDDSGSVTTRAIDLDGYFGFPQALAPLLDAYQEGHLLVIHATGSTDPSRSHFDAQRFMEVGKPGDLSIGTGWLGRHLASIAPMREDALLRAVGLSVGLPMTLAGAPQALPIPNPNRFGYSGHRSTQAERAASLSHLYSYMSDPLKAAAKTTQETITLLERIDFANYQPDGGAVYPDSAFGNALKSSAALIKADVGVEAIHVDKGGWDTHDVQNPIDGQMYHLMDDLARALAAFHTDLFSGATPNVTVVLLSEFGRNLVENGSQGTDHGHGNVMFLLGPKIDGGRVLTHNWPGLEKERLDRGRDLQVTIDYRDVLAEVVQNRLGNARLDVVFPGHAPTFYGVTRP